MSRHTIELPRSLNVYRDRLTDMSDSFDRMRSAFDQHNIEFNHIRWVGKTATRSMILNEDEIGGLLFQNDIHPNEDLIATFAGNLYDRMPGSMDTEISLPTQPIDVSIPDLRPNELLISVGANHPVLARERAEAKFLTEDFFGLNEHDIDWPVWNHAPDQMLIQITHVRTAHKIIQLLEKYPDLLPTEITVGPIIIKS